MDAGLKDVARGIAECIGTDGIAIGDGYEVAFGGACPVQGWGFVDEHPCYFRARGEGWRMEFYAFGSGVTDHTYVSKSCDEGVRPVFTHHDGGYGEYEAGWMPAENVCRHVAEAIAAFRASLAK